MILAAFDLDALIPLIVGIFWVVAQIAGAAAKKKPPTIQPRRIDPDEDPFAEMMRNFRGAKEFDLPPPPRPEPEPELEIIPLPLPPEPVKVPEPEPVEMPEVNIRPTMSSFKTAMPSMKLPSMSLSIQGAGKSGSGASKAGSIIDPANKQTLRRAVLAHIILESPKGMPAGEKLSISD